MVLLGHQEVGRHVVNDVKCLLEVLDLHLLVVSLDQVVLLHSGHLIVYYHPSYLHGWRFELVQILYRLLDDFCLGNKLACLLVAEVGRQF